MSNNCTEEMFLNDIKEHKMTVLLDSGVYRHIHFSKPQSSDKSFDLITGPGYLLYRGDMGCYEFERLHDMFSFFGCDEKTLAYHKSKGRNIPINLSYWAEKCQSESRFGSGVKKFSEEEFKANVMGMFSSYSAGMDEADIEELKERIEDEILDCIESPYQAYQSAMDFEFTDSEGIVRYPFADFWEYDSEEYTFHYIWCCYAIAWGVKMYDDSKKSGKEELK